MITGMKLMIYDIERGVKMQEVNLGVLTFEGYANFDTRKEADEFVRELGDRFIRMTECRYPDLTFYIVEYDTPKAYFK